MDERTLFQNVSFLTGDTVAIANSVWKESEALKQSQNVFKEEEVVVGPVHFLAKNSKENYFSRTQSGYIYGASTKLIATKLCKTQIPISLWEALVRKLQMIIPSYDPDEGISMKASLIRHYTALYSRIGDDNAEEDAKPDKIVDLVARKRPMEELLGKVD